MTRIVIVNQHGENRGDEAALRAMIGALAEALDGEVEFDVVVQFRDRSLTLAFDETVRLHHMVMPLPDIARLGAYALARAATLDAGRILPRDARAIVEAIAAADLVISAPGGPYFGDLYAGHEPVHWLYVWLAALHQRPLYLYAPSAGPFEKPLHNVFRRRVYSLFDGLSVREERSAEHLHELLGADAEIDLTADSALQVDVPPIDRGTYFSGPRAALADRFVVAVSGMQYAYPGDPDPPSQRAAFTEAFVACLAHLVARRRCHVVFLPQLYGRVHDDRAYHELLGRRLPPGTSWEVVPAALDATGHRAVIAMADLCLMSRYHPQIFATSRCVPGVFVVYEHKQEAYLEAVGMRDYAFDIRALEPAVMCARLDEVLERRDELVERLRARIGAVRERSRTTTRRALDVLRAGREA